MLMFINFAPFILQQPYTIINNHDIVTTGNLKSIDDYDNLLAIAEKYNVDNIQIKGKKIILNKYKDEFKKIQINKYGLKKIKMEIIE